MPDAEPACRTRKTAIGDEGNLVPHALTIDRRRGGQHLTHTGAAFRAFVADHENLAFLVVTAFNRGKGIFFTIKAARCSGEDEVFHPRHFHDRAFGGEVTAQANHTTRRAERVGHRVDNNLIRREFDIGQVFRHGLAADGDAVTMDETAIQKGFQQNRYTADFKHILGNKLAARLEVSDIGCALENLGHIMQIKFDPAFGGERG